MHSIPISGSQKAVVHIQTENKKSSFLADFHSGKQRLRCTKALQDELVLLLKEGKKVTIEVDGYQEIVEPYQFEKFFKHLQSPPFRIPFHLPI